MFRDLIAVRNSSNDIRPEQSDTDKKKHKLD
jgi:hypothetical protein